MTARDDEAVLGEPRLDAVPAKGGRSKERSEPAADDVQRAVRRERRAREQAKDQIIAELVEVRSAPRQRGSRGVSVALARHGGECREDN